MKKKRDEAADIRKNDKHQTLSFLRIFKKNKITHLGIWKKKIYSCCVYEAYIKLKGKEKKFRSMD